MHKNNIKAQRIEPLLANLFGLIEKHRAAFKQERPYQRAIWLLLSELFTFSRHTISQGLLALGETENDWSAWYRLFSHPRYDYDQLTNLTVQETISATCASEPYRLAVDGVLIPRSSRKMPGTAWLKALGTAPFRPGLARAQRFVNISWLAPLVAGYSRAFPLRMLPAFTQKAVGKEEHKRKDWEAALLGIGWVRQQMDLAGRAAQRLLVLVDGGLERPVEFWRQLPERTLLLARTARNRSL
jgi:hypothetical protein